MEVPPIIRDKDPFAKAPPGYSLTLPEGKWNWDRPPQYVDPDDAVDHVIDRIETPRGQERYLKMLVAGISIQEIVESIAIGGFQQGFFNPDVAELIKMPLAVYFMNMAEENDIPVNVFATKHGGPPDMVDTVMDDMMILDIMARRNPEVYRETARRFGPGFDERGQEMAQETVAVIVEPEGKGGFLDVEEGEV